MVQEMEETSAPITFLYTTIIQVDIMQGVPKKTPDLKLRLNLWHPVLRNIFTFYNNRLNKLKNI